LEHVEILEESYQIPDGFNPQAVLSDAWGIWFTENEPVEVTLRFHAGVAKRVRETRWHPSEEVHEEKDGSLTWRARIAAAQEMLPWIRGWGAEVEVVGPQALREQILLELRRAAENYEQERP
jgi:CRISPR-associated endonuclease/helicase Cas3